MESSFKLATGSLLVAGNLLDLLLLLAAIDLSLFILFLPTAIVNVWVTAKFFLSSHPLAETQKKPTLHHNDSFFLILFFLIFFFFYLWRG